MKIRRIHFLFLLLGVMLMAIPFRRKVRSLFVSLIVALRGKKTVADRLAQYESIVKARLEPGLKQIGVSFPPKKLILIGLKQEKTMEVWVSGEELSYELLKTYPILGLSGGIGPKLREGDQQVPEGIYRIESLNPNSLFHLSLRLDYPNAFDKSKAKGDGRVNLGGDIMIHGGAASIGCLAVGDEAAEDLFVLAAKTGLQNIEVIISPLDFRRRELPAHLLKQPEWSDELYRMIRQKLKDLKKERKT